MGRRKIQIKFIEKQKTRDITLRKRAKGILKKLKEFAILTGSHGEVVFYNNDKTEYSSIFTDDIEYNSISNNVINDIVNVVKIKNELVNEKKNNFEDYNSDNVVKIKNELINEKENIFEDYDSDNTERYPYFPEYINESVNNYITRILGF